MQQLHFRSLSSTPVSVPIKQPVVTSAQVLRTMPLVLVDLETDEGITGHAYAFCYTEAIAKSLVVILDDLSKALAGRPVAPRELSGFLSRYFKLCGMVGPLLMAASTVDVAAWDALAIAANMPLVRLLGASHQGVPAYNSCGLMLVEPAAAADEAESMVAAGFRAAKMRMGRSDFRDDLAAVRAVRKRVPDHVALMVDFNQALTPAQAMQYCPALDGEGVYWIEEPIRHDRYKDAASIARASTTPIQLGENCIGPKSIADVLRADASDYLMFDLDRIGGVTGWLHAAGLAAAHDRQVSSHLFPEVSTQLLAATPNRHWLEYVDWADPLLQEPLKIVNGDALASERAGNGLRWNMDAVTRYRIA